MAAEQLQLQLTQRCTVTVLFDGVVTTEAIEKLIMVCKLLMDCYPTERDLSLAATAARGEGGDDELDRRNGGVYTG
jgi:hypothetical protein